MNTIESKTKNILVKCFVFIWLSIHVATLQVLLFIYSMQKKVKLYSVIMQTIKMRSDWKRSYFSNSSIHRISL